MKQNKAGVKPGRGFRSTDKHIDEWFADQIHTLRKAKGYTQAGLATRLGVSQRTVEKVETGNIVVRLDMYERFNDFRLLAPAGLPGLKTNV